MRTVHAVIADIVGSRRLEDRASAQRVFLGALTRAADGLDLAQPPRATVGDEFQAVAATVHDALELTLRTHLLLPARLALRFGIGAGEVSDVDPTADDVVQDGTAWWSARQAIEDAHALEDDGLDFARTRLRIDGAAQHGAASAHRTDRAVGSARPSTHGAGEPGTPDGGALVQASLNAMLLLREQAVFRLQARQRRVLAGLVLGRTQVEIAREERISQQAVSELARGAGAGVLAAHRELIAASGSAS